MRFECGKGIRRDLRPCRRNARDERGLACVGEANETDVREQFQFEAHVALFALFTIFMLARSLMPGLAERWIPVAAPAASAMSREKALARLGEIVKLLARI